MWSVLFLAFLTATAVHAETVLVPKTSFQALGSTIILQASGLVNNVKLSDLKGSIQVQHPPFTVGVSLSEDQSLSAVYDYSNQFDISPIANLPLLADIDLYANLGSQSRTGGGSATVQAPTITGSPQASVSVGLTGNGLNNYGLGLIVGSDSDTVQVNAQLNGQVNQGISLQGTTIIGPVKGVVSRDLDGLWDEKLDAELTILDKPQVILFGKIHHDKSNEAEYDLGLKSPTASAKIHINPDNTVDYHLETIVSGTLFSNPCTTQAKGGYFTANNAVTYSFTTTAGSITGVFSGTLYADYNLEITIDFSIFEIYFKVGTNGQPSYYVEVTMNDSNVILWFDGNFKPTSFSGTFGNNPSLTVQTAFDGQYSFSVTNQEEALIFDEVI